MSPARLLGSVPTGGGQTALKVPWENVQVPVNLSVFLVLLLQPTAATRASAATQPEAPAANRSRALARCLPASEGHLRDPFDEVTIKIASFFGRPGQVLAVGEIGVRVRFYHVDLVVMRQPHVDTAVVSQPGGLVGAHR